MSAKKRSESHRTPSPVEAGLHVGAVVMHRNRGAGLGVHQHTGTIGAFVAPSPGWHRAIVAWRDEDGRIAYEQFVDTDRLEIAPTPVAVGEPEPTQIAFPGFEAVPT